MRIVKLILAIVAWLGLAQVLITNCVLFLIGIDLPYRHDFPYNIGLPGAVIAVIGGLIAKPRFLWGSMIVVGIFGFLSLVLAFWYFLSWGSTPLGLVILIWVIPEIIVIAGGIMVKKLRERYERSQSEPFVIKGGPWGIGE